MILSTGILEEGKHTPTTVNYLDSADAVASKAFDLLPLRILGL